MKIITSCASLALGILATCSGVRLADGRPFPATLSKGSTSTHVPSSNKAPPSLSRVPWQKPNLAKEVDNASSKPSKTRLQMLMEALFQGILASEMTNRLASILRLDPTAILVFANWSVNVLWKMAASNNPDLLLFMSGNFILRSDDLANRRVHSMLLAGFSHMSQNHLSSNMGTLLVLGPQVAKLMGDRYPYFYVAAIYASDLYDQIIYQPKNIPKRKGRFLFWTFDLPSGSLGASGAICALQCYYTLNYPLQAVNLTKMDERGRRILLNQTAVTATTTTTDLRLMDKSIEIPAWIYGMTSLIMDLFPTKGSNIGHGAHLGGYIFGAAFFLVEYLWKKWRSTSNQTMKGRGRPRRRIGFLSILQGVASGLSTLTMLLQNGVTQLLGLLEDYLVKELNSFVSLFSAADNNQHDKDEEDRTSDSSQSDVPHWDFHPRLEKLTDEFESELDEKKPSDSSPAHGVAPADWDLPDLREHND